MSEERMRFEVRAIEGEGPYFTLIGVAATSTVARQMGAEAAPRQKLIWIFDREADRYMARVYPSGGIGIFGETPPKTAPLPKPSLWLGETGRVLLLAMAKACEEANELGTILSRSIAQGLDGNDPKTAKSNREALIDEMADMSALLVVLEKAMRVTPIERERLMLRADQKAEHKHQWLDMACAHFTERGEVTHAKTPSYTRTCD